MICRGYSTNNVHACGRGDVRLLNATQSQNFIQGRVEICNNGQWVGICQDSNWKYTYARLICQKLLQKSPKGKFMIRLIVNMDSI